VRNPQDAEDLTQETFVKAFTSLTKFDTRYAFSTWIFKIASNSTIDFIRRQRMQTYSINDNTEDGVNNPLQIEDTGLIAHDIVMRDQRKEYLAIAIAKLPERYQQLITLRYFDEYSYEEVAQQLKVPLGTVKAQLHRARELLNDELSRIENSL
jgi:RNA polymerase sigma-70 factor (ECF subfamily)